MFPRMQNIFPRLTSSRQSYIQDSFCWGLKSFSGFEKIALFDKFDIHISRVSPYLFLVRISVSVFLPWISILVSAEPLPMKNATLISKDPLWAESKDTVYHRGEKETVTPNALWESCGHSCFKAVTK